MLSVRKISKTYQGFAIKDVSFEVHQGQYFVLLGRTGAGKSILLETIAGLTSPESGRVFLDGKDITCEKMRKRQIGLVFQNTALFPHMSVYDNVAYSLRWCGKPRSQTIQRVTKLAEDFGFSHLLTARPHTLSAGESQRVSLARAVAGEPRCLLLDEPLSSLDTTARAEIRALLRNMSSRGHVILHVTHDYAEAVSLGTHIAVMEDGRIAQVGTIEEIFQRPQSEFIARFVGIRNFFKGRLEDSGGQGVGLRCFSTRGLIFSVLTDGQAGTGYIMVRSEDITICNQARRTSARNNFKGAIVDIVPAGGGLEVIVDIGLEIAAIITAESAKALGLSHGKKVWITFKASAVQYIEV